MTFPHFYRYDTPIGYELLQERDGFRHRECYQVFKSEGFHYIGFGSKSEDVADGTWVFDDCYTQVCPDQVNTWHG